MGSFFSLIDQLNTAATADRGSVEADIWKSFGVEMALFALDMSEFSLTVRRTGILPYLGIIRRMQVMTAPIVKECGGTVVKYHADNLMAVFPDVAGAVDAAVRIHGALDGASGSGCGLGCTVGIGIDYGAFLMIPGEDCYGDTVNVACKLGEDLARPGEVLLTLAARERLGAAFAHPVTEQYASISGLELVTYRIDYRGKP